jgi:SAM-dependent methyltransferase
MKPELLDYLCCPSTREPLKLVSDHCEGGEIVSGKLLAEGSGREYPIIKGIPRFVFSKKELYQNYTQSFGHQWNQYNWLRDEDVTEFETILDRKIEAYHGLRILDAGCGGGRIARHVAAKSRLYVGVDYSIACERAQELCRHIPQAHFIQADILNLPLRPEPSFDFVFSHGVLHHTPSTRLAFDSIARLIRPGGELYIAVFRKAFLLLRVSDGLVRLIVNRLPVGAQTAFCRFLVHLQRLPWARTLKRVFWFSLQPNAEIATFCNYDWYAPRYHHEHTAVEVMNWFAAAGFHQIQYVDAWPYAPAHQKYSIPGFRQSFRLGQLVGVVGTRLSQQAAFPVRMRHAA